MKGLTIGFLILEEHRRLLGDLPERLKEWYKIKYIFIDQKLELISQQALECSLIVTPGEYIPLQIVPLAVVSELGVPTLHIMDGILEWRNWFKRPFLQEDMSPYPPPHPFLLPSMCNYIACLGLNQKLMLDSFGNFGRTVIVGSPRLDLFLNQYMSLPEYGKSLSSPRVLIATANTPAFSVEQYRVVLSYMIKLKQYLERKKIDVIWRITRKLAEDIAVKCSNESILLDISLCSAIFTTPSTVWLEGMLAKKPTGILNPFSEPLMLQSPWVINSENDFYLIEESFLAHKGKMRLQDYYLSLNLLKGGATDRLIALIRQILSDGLAFDVSRFESTYLTVKDMFPEFFRGFKVKDVVDMDYKDFHLLDCNVASMKIKNLIERVRELEASST